MAGIRGVATQAAVIPAVATRVVIPAAGILTRVVETVHTVGGVLLVRIFPTIKSYNRRFALPIR